MSRIELVGAAWNVARLPRTRDPQTDRICANSPRAYRIKAPWVFETWTEWINVHSARHMWETYPHAMQLHLIEQNWQRRPIYLRAPDPLFPSSLRFPATEIQNYFSIDKTPFRYITFSGAWMIAYAGYRIQTNPRLYVNPIIDLYGFELGRDRQTDQERPCFWYWVERMRALGIVVNVPPDVEPTAPGDPRTYTGPLYGYETNEPACSPIACLR